MALDSPPIIYRLCSPHTHSRARCSRQIGLSLTALTHNTPPALCPHICRRRVHGRKVVVSGKPALLSATSPQGRETVLEGLWWWLGTLVRTELCVVLGIVPLRVLRLTMMLTHQPCFPPPSFPSRMKSSTWRSLMVSTRSGIFCNKLHHSATLCKTNV